MRILTRVSLLLALIVGKNQNYQGTSVPLKINPCLINGSFIADLNRDGISSCEI